MRTSSQQGDNAAGEMARRVRSTDWSSTPLGPMDRWPQSLRIAVDICLSSRFSMFVWWGPELIYIYNDAHAAVLGKRHPSALGRPAAEVWHEIWDPDIGAEVDAVMQRGEATWNDRRKLIMERNGYREETWFTWSYSPIRDESGAVAGLFCVNTEETPRVLAERAAREAEGRYRAVFDAVRDAVLVYTPQGTVVEANPAACRVYGYAREQLIGVDARQVIHPDARPHFEEFLRIAGAGGDFRCRTVDRRQDGSPFPIEVVGTSLIHNGTRLLMSMVRDVTQEEALSRAVESERANLAGIVEYAPAFICTLRGPEHVFERVNERYFQMVGRRDILGKPVREALPEVEAQGFIELLDRVYRTGETFTGNEVPIVIRRNGDEAPNQRFLNFVYQALRGPDGAVRGIFVHGADVTELVVARRALHEANLLLEERVRERTAQLAEVNARFQAMYDQGIFAGFVDLHGTVIDANRSSLEQCGFTREDVIGKPFWECGWWNRSAAVQGWIREGVAQAVRGEPFRGESPYFVADGSERVVEFALMPIRDEAGRVLHLLATGIDVTDSRRATLDRQAAEVLRESEAQFRLIADAMPQIVWVTRADGYHEYYNRRWYEFVGLDFEQTKGEGWGNPLHPDDEPRARRRWQHSLSTGEPYEIEYRFRRHDGAYRWFLARALPIRNAAGVITRWYGTCTDIHDQKQFQSQREQLLESERAARAEAETANRAKDRFLAILSHELRTPLTPVAMAATAMEMDPRLPFEFREDVAMVRRNVELETRLIDDLLDLSRVTSGKLRLNPQPTHVHHVIRHVLETVGPELHERQLRVEKSLAAEQDLVDADPARLQQTLWNLLKNAAKFTPPGGDVAIRTRNEAGRLVIEVQDSGKGIPPDVLPRIFDPFEQGAAEVTRRYGGMGLGLAIAKAVVDLHGGTIAASSPGDGQGARFTVSLPLGRAAATRGASATDEFPVAASGRPVRLLLVEDHPDTAKTLVRLLRLDGSEVQWASTVAGALELATSEAFDLIVSDLGLPDGSGHELMRQIRRHRPVPGIAMSGYGMEEDIRQSRDAGFVEHLVKPVALPQLREAIRRAARTPS